MKVVTPAGQLWVRQTHPGRTPVALLWPGLFCDGSVFDATLEGLTEASVLVVDPPGHGSSDAATFTLDDCARAVPIILDAFGVARTVMVGHAWGAVVALKAALLEPLRFRSLVLLHPTAEADAPLVSLKNRVLHQVVRSRGLSPFARSAITTTIFSPSTSPATVDAALNLASSWRPDGMAQAIRAVLLQRRTFLHELSRLELPVAIAIGSDDRAFPPQHGQRVAGAIPAARLTCWSNVGHMSPLEAPGKVRAMITDALV